MFSPPDLLKINLEGIQSLQRPTLAYSYLSATRKTINSCYVEESLQRKTGREKKPTRTKKKPANQLYKVRIMAALSQKKGQSCLRINKNRCLGKKSNNSAHIQYALTVFHNMQLTDYCTRGFTFLFYPTQLLMECSSISIYLNTS